MVDFNHRYQPGQAAFQTNVTSATGDFGSLAISSNGTYTYTVSNAAAAYLDAGQTKVDTFTITSIDGTTQQVSFNIHGTNQAAVIGTPTVVDVTENPGAGGNLIATGSISITDVNQGQAAFQTTVTSTGGNLGSLVLNSNGTYTYSVANSAAAYLDAGQTKVDSFTITSIDGTTQQVSFNIHGTNQAAVIGTPTVTDVTENPSAAAGTNLTASGSISITDVNQGESAFHTTVTSAQGNLGLLTLSANGNYTYSVANSAAAYLDAGQTKVDTFTVTSVDGTTQQVSFNIHGTNQAAVIGTPTVTDVTENPSAVAGTNLTASGSISITDVNQGQAAFQTTVTSATGDLGSLVISSNGTYTYTVSNAAAAYLDAGQTKVDTFTITSIDGTTQQVSFNIHGTNQAAVIGTPTVVDVTENPGAGGNLTASGSISITDVNQGQAAFQTTVTSTGGNLGSLVLNSNGTYTYSVANSAAAYLDAGQTKVDTFTVTSVDGTTQQVSFDIHGTNQAAVIGTPTVTDVTENPSAVAGTNLTASGSISITDVNQGESAFHTTVTSAQGNLGTLTLAANGSYTYSVANSAAAYLDAGQIKVDTFTITSVDGTTQQVSFDIHGTNQAAVIGTPTVVDVTENPGAGGNLTATGSISITDVNQGQAAFQTTVTSATGDLGSLVISSNGTYTYTVSNAAAAYLDAGQTKVDTFTVTSVDGTTQQVSFNIHGTNQAAVIGTPTVVDVTENPGAGGNLTASGSISITDVNQGQAAFQTTVTSASGDLGSLVISSNGTYTYTVSNAAAAYLDAGQTKVDTFTITSIDGTTQQVSFNIHGTNQAAVIGTPTVTDVTENPGAGGNLTATGSISITDVNQGQAAFQTTVTSTGGNLGSLVLNSNGTYTYSVANSAAAYLDAGQTKVDTFTVTSVDGTTQQVSFNIHGTNQAAVIGTPTVVDVTENPGAGGNLTASGSISITDVNQGQAAFQTTVTSASGDLGSLVISSNGTYTYTVSNAAAAYLDAGQTKVDTFTITSIDGTTQQVSFNIHGTNQAAVIGTPTVTDVTENPGAGGNLTATGSISITDVNQGQAAFQTTVTSASGDLGSLVISSNGTYTYTVSNAAAAYLDAGQTKVDTFTITSIDGTTQQVSFNIHGTNQAAVIGTPTVTDVTENPGAGGNLTATGSISITDVNQGQAAFQTTVTSTGGNLGSLVLNSNGTYTYSVANSAAAYLDAGQTKVDTFTVTSIDGTTQQVSFNIHGTNQAAVIGTPTVVDVTENPGAGGNLTASGSISITDVNQGQAAFQTTVTSTGGNLGSLVLNSNGTYTYSVANSAAAYLDAGQTKVDTFTVTSVDGTTQQVSFDIHGTNQAAVIGTPTVSTVTEGVNVSGGNLTAAGTLSISDVNQGQSAFQTTVTSTGGDLGSLVISSTGAYTYTVSNTAAAYLDAGQTKVDTFTVTSIDGTTQQVSFTIYGTNQAAVIGTPTVSTVTEGVNVSGGNLTASGTIPITDVNQGQSAFQTTVTSAGGDLGTLTLAASGAYTYTVANSAAAYLDAGQTKVDTFTVTSVDGTTQQVNFTIYGTNQAAVIGTPTVSTVTENTNINSSGNLTATGSISITDVNQGQSAFQTTVVAAQGDLGTLTLNANGTYTYTVANSATQSLLSGQTHVDAFTVTSVDGTTSTVDFTIQGASHQFNTAITTNTSAAAVVEVSYVNTTAPWDSTFSTFAVSSGQQTTNVTTGTNYTVNGSNYEIAVENVTGSKITVTDFNTGYTDSGSINLQIGDDSGGTKHAFTTVITPGTSTTSGTLVQADTLSTDSSSSINHSASTGVQYLYGDAGLLGGGTITGDNSGSFLSGTPALLAPYSLVGGSGNDVLVYNSGDTSIDGGGGFNILRVDGTGNNISVSSQLNNISIIDLNGYSVSGSTVSAGTNTITLSANSLLNLSNETLANVQAADSNFNTLTQNYGVNASDKVLFVSGNANTQVTLSDGSWTAAGTVNEVSGHGFNAYTHASGTHTVAILISTDITHVTGHS